MTNSAGNQNTGTILLMVTFPWPWPCARRIQIVQHGAASIFAEPNGSLLAQIISDHKIFEFESCPILLDVKTSTNVGLSWKLPDTINMIVGQTIVLSTERPDSVPSEARIPSGVPNDTRDFTKENEQALQRRRDTLAGSKADKKPKPNRREASTDEIFDALERAQQELADLLDLVRRGKTHHIGGLLRLLTLMVTDSKDKPLPLLQMCAAIAGVPLIVFAPPINASKKPLPTDGVETLACSINSTPTDLLKNAVDIDVWLESRAAQLNGRVLNQKQLIDNISNSVARHFDIRVRDEADMLRSWKSEITDVTYDFTVHYTTDIAMVINALVSQTLAKKPNRQNHSRGS